MNDTMRWHGNDIPKVTVIHDIIHDRGVIKAGTGVWLFGTKSLNAGEIDLKVVCDDGLEVYLPEEGLKHFKSKP